MLTTYIQNYCCVSPSLKVQQIIVIISKNDYGAFRPDDWKRAYREPLFIGLQISGKTFAHKNHDKPQQCTEYEYITRICTRIIMYYVHIEIHAYTP
jgi:hypothetical protein